MLHQNGTPVDAAAPHTPVIQGDNHATAERKRSDSGSLMPAGSQVSGARSTNIRHHALDSEILLVNALCLTPG